MVKDTLFLLKKKLKNLKAMVLQALTPAFQLSLTKQGLPEKIAAPSPQLF